MAGKLRRRRQRRSRHPTRDPLRSRRLDFVEAKRLRARGIVDTTTKALIETIGDNGNRVEKSYVDALPVVVADATSSGRRKSVIHRALVDPIPDQAEFSG